jgi:hypothetical protein
MAVASFNFLLQFTMSQLLSRGEDDASNDANLALDKLSLDDKEASPEKPPAKEEGEESDPDDEDEDDEESEGETSDEEDYESEEEEQSFIAEGVDPLTQVQVGRVRLGLPCNNRVRSSAGAEHGQIQHPDGAGSSRSQLFECHSLFHFTFLHATHRRFARG